MEVDISPGCLGRKMLCLQIGSSSTGSSLWSFVVVETIEGSGKLTFRNQERMNSGSLPFSRGKSLFSGPAGPDAYRGVWDRSCNGWIRPSLASHAAAIVFARKADRTKRFFVDYRALNSITARSVEPLPNIDQLLEEVRGSTCFSKLDLASAYHQFRIAPDDVPKTSFRVPGGQYEFRIGAFGLHGM